MKKLIFFTIVVISFGAEDHDRFFFVTIEGTIKEREVAMEMVEVYICQSNIRDSVPYRQVQTINAPTGSNWSNRLHDTTNENGTFELSVIYRGYKSEDINVCYEENGILKIIFTTSNSAISKEDTIIVSEEYTGSGCSQNSKEISNYGYVTEYKNIEIKLFGEKYEENNNAYCSGTIV